MRVDEFSFQLPNGADGVGLIEFKITADLNSNIAEANPDGTAETNNVITTSRQSTLASSPDLQVSNLRTLIPE